MIRRGMRARVRIPLLAGCLLALLVGVPRAGAVGLQSIGPTFTQPIFATSPPGDPRLFVVERRERPTPALVRKKCRKRRHRPKAAATRTAAGSSAAAAAKKHKHKKRHCKKRR